MATFLAINTSSVTLIPFTVIGLRVAAGSTNAAKPLAGIIMTTVVSTTVAIVVCRLLSKRPGYAMPQSSAEQTGVVDADAGGES
jgi:spore maturation protein A